MGNNALAKLSFLFSSFLLELSISTITPLAVCDFNDGETCGWMHEDVVWNYRWTVERGSLCLSAKSTSFSPTKKTSSWLTSLSAGLKKPIVDTRVRFISPPISAAVGMKCIDFVYTIDLPRGRTFVSNGSSRSLALFQQQEGCLICVVELCFSYFFLVVKMFSFRI